MGWRGITHILVLITGLLVLVKMRPGGQEGAQGHTMSLCHTLAMDLAQAGSTVESKIYDTLQWQVKGQLGGCGLTVRGCRLPSVTLLYCCFPPDLDPSAWFLHKAHRCGHLLQRAGADIGYSYQ